MKKILNILSCHNHINFMRLDKRNSPQKTDTLQNVDLLVINYWFLLILLSPYEPWYKWKSEDFNFRFAGMLYVFIDCICILTVIIWDKMCPGNCIFSNNTNVIFYQSCCASKMDFWIFSNMYLIYGMNGITLFDSPQWCTVYKKTKKKKEKQRKTILVSWSNYSGLYGTEL